ncbi:MAG TPA: C25 family cysteine peptidase, partial [Vicinamibacteria bacterium]
MYPESLARVLSEGYQGETKKTQLELSPLRWNRTTGELSLSRKLTVRLVFTGKKTTARRESAARGKRSVSRRLVTREPGLYAVSYDEIAGGRRRGFAASSLRLSRLGKTVAFHLEPESGAFGPGSRLYFLSEGASLNPYGNEAVYELESSAAGATMPKGSVQAQGVGVSYYWKDVEREENRYYQAGLLDAEDLWLWDVLVAPVTKSYSFDVSASASVGEPARLFLWLWGVSDLPESPDHHVRVAVNGTPVLDTSFEGKAPLRVTAEIPEGVLREGENEVSLENVGDTGAQYSMVMLDRFMVSYPRRLLAERGVLEGGFRSSGVAEVEGVPGEALVLDVTEKPARWIGNNPRFRVESGRRYLVVSPEAVRKPAIENVPASTLMSTRNGADYLILGPGGFLEAAKPLLELRRSQGLRSRGVAIEDVYSEFGYGESRPEAVKDFLSYAYEKWQKPAPRYVLLLGDASYDFKDYLGTGVKNEVPPWMVKTSYLWTASDPGYAEVHGDDELPDVAIGRLPAATVEEARVMVEKILAYETAGSVSRGAVVLVADNADGAGDFEADAETIAASVLA